MNSKAPNGRLFHSFALFLLLVFAPAFLLSCGTRKAAFQVSTVVPAAVGNVKVKKTTTIIIL
jgi:hypothetical protein